VVVLFLFVHLENHLNSREEGLLSPGAEVRPRFEHQPIDAHFQTLVFRANIAEPTVFIGLAFSQFDPTLVGLALKPDSDTDGGFTDARVEHVKSQRPFLRWGEVLVIRVAKGTGRQPG
jgi:hypothetical protein